MTDQPILYSFRRCPYAIRARLALAYAECEVELREVVLKNKPAAMLEASPKGTVPVLVLPEGDVIEESLDVMLWALQKHDPADWLRQDSAAERMEIEQLIDHNDQQFKPLLDRYKYADRYPEHSAETYRSQGEGFLQLLDKRLQKSEFLLGQSLSLADVALFPFIRQFAQVDRAWFDQTHLTCLQHWLAQLEQSPLFGSVMRKYPPWQPGDSATRFPPRN